MKSKKDREFMEIAVDEMLQSQSEHTNKEDPLVGAVLVNKEGCEIARAHRGNFNPGDHAEFTIFGKLVSDEDTVGGILYVTLEPCTIRNRPKKPCSQWIIDKGIERVVIGIRDPNPDIYNIGVSYLLKHGVKVDFFDDDLAEDIRNRNEDFINFMLNNKKKKVLTMTKAKTKSDRLEGPSHEEERPVTEANTKDFSNKAIQKYLSFIKLAYKIPSLKLWTDFRRSKFLVKRNNRDVPTLGGIVLFGDDPGHFLPEHSITAECFSGTPDDGISLNKIVGNGRLIITGPLFDMVTKTVQFYKKHVAKVPQVKNYQRVDRDFEYPVEVIREVLVNALVHRDYTVGAHISFRMFKDRIIIKSPGHLLSPNTIERVKSFDVTPVRRNQRIAHAAFKMKLMEKEGYGIPNMRTLMKEYKLRSPDFNFVDGYFVVTLYGREKSSSQVSKIQPELLSKLKTRQREILEHIEEHGRITSEDTMKKFNITRETANTDFRKLIDLNIIERKGKGKATFYVFARN
ncbi:MAG: DeoR family transcriptional regulator [Ignavibacteria bacterium]|nr:DeoR family transcriptional regulator [Ignavibacteria bacterium]